MLGMRVRRNRERSIQNAPLMRKYLLAVLATIAGTIIAVETAELALDANGNTAKILIPNIEDRFTIEE